MSFFFWRSSSRSRSALAALWLSCVAAVGRARDRVELDDRQDRRAGDGRAAGWPRSASATGARGCGRRTSSETISLVYRSASVHEAVRVGELEPVGVDLGLLLVVVPYGGATGSTDASLGEPRPASRAAATGWCRSTLPRGFRPDGAMLYDANTARKTPSSSPAAVIRRNRQRTAAWRARFMDPRLGSVAGKRPLAHRSGSDSGVDLRSTPCPAYCCSRASSRRSAAPACTAPSARSATCPRTATRPVVVTGSGAQRGRWDAQRPGAAGAPAGRRPRSTVCPAPSRPARPAWPRSSTACAWARTAGCAGGSSESVAPRHPGGRRRRRGDLPRAPRTRPRWPARGWPPSSAGRGSPTSRTRGRSTRCACIRRASTARSTCGRCGRRWRPPRRS